MNLSMRWLGDHVALNVTPREFAEAMTMSGSKVESYKAEGGNISGIVVGRVVSVKEHPNADLLFICEVDVGAESNPQIVTAALNVTEGALVPVALNKAILHDGKQVLAQKMRGEISEGMLCSLQELGLQAGDFPYADEEGVFIIEEPCSPGDDIKKALGFDDVIVEFEITSNRPDCLSVRGLAREAAVTYKKALSLPSPVIKNPIGRISDHLSVEVKNSELCPRYFAMMVKDVKIGPSPRWMRERLRASGLRPINNIVDITNYVMLEYGQPLHAFDYKNIAGKKIIVRNAEENETITTLDDVKRNLARDMLLIADKKGALAVAGVMGGEYSSINDETKTVVFESACFSGQSVRATSRKIGLRTESSSRFEKGLDPSLCQDAAMRACELVERLGAGVVVGGFIDVDNSKKHLARIPFDYRWINEFLGTELTASVMKDILLRLGFEIDGSDVIAPSWRADVSHKADISEEIARFYGYDNISVTMVDGVAQASRSDYQKFEGRVTGILIAQGLYEVVTSSFAGLLDYDKINLPEGSGIRDSVKIINPLGEDTGFMRSTTLPSMLEVLARNYNNRVADASLFELGFEYLPAGENVQPYEKQKATLGMYGGGVDFFVMKGVVEQLLDRIGMYGYETEAVTDNPTFHPGRCASLSVGGIPFGIIGEAHPVVLENYGVNTRVYLAKLDMELMFKNRGAEKKYTPLAKYPSVTRDIAVTCDESTPAKLLEKAIRSAARSLLEKVELFDVYKGAQIPEGKKSVAYSITLRAHDRTLTDAEADGVVTEAVELLKELGAAIRA